MDAPEDYARLLAKIAQGDRNAEDRLVSRFWRGVYFQMYRQTHDHELSEDLAQEALCVVLTKAREEVIANAKALSSFIHNTAENLLIALRRKERRRQTFTNNDAIEQAKSDNASLLAQVNEEQLNDFVETMLAGLSMQRDKDILRYHYLMGKDKTVICQMMGLTPAHYDRVLHRARKRLKEMIENSSPDEGPPDLTVICLAFAAFILAVASHNAVSASRVGVLAHSHHFEPKRVLNLPRKAERMSIEGNGNHG